MSLVQCSTVDVLLCLNISDLLGSVQVRPEVWPGVLQPPAGQPGQTVGHQDQARGRSESQPAARPPGQDGAEPGAANELWGPG